MNIQLDVTYSFSGTTKIAKLVFLFDDEKIHFEVLKFLEEDLFTHNVVSYDELKIKAEMKSTAAGWDSLEKNAGDLISWVRDIKAKVYMPEPFSIEI